MLFAGPDSTNNYQFNMSLVSGEAYFTYIKRASTDPLSTIVLTNKYILPHQDATGENTYTLATVEDIPTLSGLTMRNYKIVINDQYQYNFSVPYEFNTDLSKYEAIRKIPVNSVIVDITNRKTGVFRWQTSSIAVIYWADNTSTPISFTDGFDCVISANAPATM